MSNDEFKHGFDSRAWEAAKTQARSVLCEHARRKRTISYSDLADKIGAIQIEPHDIRFGYFLGQISTEDDERGLGLTTVIVVHKGGGMKPGPGFYDLAESRGRDVSNLDECFIKEMNAVFEHWSKRR